MPKYKLSPEERAAEKERKENLRNLMQGLDVKNFDDLKNVFKLMVGEMLENESAKYTERAEKQGCRGHFDCLC